MSLTGNSTLSNYVPFPFLSAIFRHRCHSLWRAGASLTSSLHTFLAKNEMIAFHLLKESVSRDLRPLILLFKRIYLGITCICELFSFLRSYLLAKFKIYPNFANTFAKK